MAVINEAIILNADQSLSFGNYEVKEKQKVENFDVNGDIYKVRTHNEVTRLSKNTKLLLETVPGATIHNLVVEDNVTTFAAEGKGSTQVTLELEAEQSYNIYVEDVNIGTVKTNVAGKVNFGMDLNSNPQFVKVEKH